MLVNVAIKLVQGALVAVHTYLYSDGSVINRIVDLHTGIPLGIV